MELLIVEFFTRGHISLAYAYEHNASFGNRRSAYFCKWFLLEERSDSRVIGNPWVDDSRPPTFAYEYMYSGKWICVLLHINETALMQDIGPCLTTFDEQHIQNS